MSKLNKTLFDAIVHIEDQNGFEVLRVFNDKANKVP